MKTEKDLHIERIYRDSNWWELQLEKLKTFYFDSLFPELACPRHRSGGIREPSHRLDFGCFFYFFVVSIKVATYDAFTLNY